MAFTDIELNSGLAGFSISGLTLSKTALLTLEVASGSVTVHQTGSTYTLATAQDHSFTADATNSKKVFMGLIDNGTTTDLWVDSYIDDGNTQRAAPPSGYNLIREIAWFDLAANETDLDNSTIYRRAYI